jgi:hypothetical protein
MNRNRLFGYYREFGKHFCPGMPVGADEEIIVLHFHQTIGKRVVAVIQEIKKCSLWIFS